MAALSIAFLIALPSASAANAASASSAGDLLSVLGKSYGRSATLAGEFTQRRKDVVVGGVRETSGALEIKRPSKFRWETLAPDPSLLATDGKTVWHYTPPFRAGGRGQVLIRSAADVQSRLAVDLLSGGADLRRSFRVSRLGEGHYELRPRKPAGDIQKIALYLDQATKLVYKLVLFHETGNETEIVLRNIRRGVKLDDSRFRFKAPPGTDEIR